MVKWVISNVTTVTCHQVALAHKPLANQSSKPSPREENKIILDALTAHEQANF